MATPNPYDLEQDAFLRQMGGGNSTMPVGGNPAAAGGALTPAPQTSGLSTSMVGDTQKQDLTPVGNGVEARNALGGYAGVGPMSGFRQDGYGGDMKAANSMKNTFGRIASRYGNDAAGFQSLMGDADFQRYFPNATYDGKDRINFGGQLSDFESGTPVYDVDVAQGWENGAGQNWQWLDQVNTGGGSQGGMDANMAPPSDLMQALTAGGGLTGNDTLERIQKELQALINGQPSNVSQDAFSQAMR